MGVHREINNYRARLAGLRKEKGILYGLFDVAFVGYLKDLFCSLCKDAFDVDMLELVRIETALLDLAGKYYQRYRISKRVRNCSECIGNSGSGSNDGNPYRVTRP